MMFQIVFSVLIACKGEGEVLDQAYRNFPAASDDSSPTWAAGALSYLTVSRHADIALRSFAYFENDLEKLSDSGDELEERWKPQSAYTYRKWRTRAWWKLGGFIVGGPILAWLLLAALPRREGA